MLPDATASTKFFFYLDLEKNFRAQELKMRRPNIDGAAITLDHVELHFLSTFAISFKAQVLVLRH